MMLPPGSRLHHRPGHPLGAEDDVLEVGPVERVPAVLRGLEDRRREHAAGVVDQDAHRSELGDGAGQGRVHLGRLADVGGDAEPADLLGRRRRGLGIALPDRHRGAEGGQAAGDAAADPRPAAGHDGHPVGEQHR